MPESIATHHLPKTLSGFLPCIQALLCLILLFDSLIPEDVLEITKTMFLFYFAFMASFAIVFHVFQAGKQTRCVAEVDLKTSGSPFSVPQVLKLQACATTTV